ncbi:hypothetical protein K469DRAFT_678836 [Zopfia rhizophila CBS 207.26]|uniref:Xylanolytic transcriptional activator regulatory domain-containing protein n=1 Tax=Zopfia rhizophila CBS 207.26 TaxID=1314779 RepID=A0A6A6DFQ1_9PEZI|nr:hypothetical protein K469DRAFT_678836 [Zopfia rhizophila CBS 207.26]
MMTMSSSMMTSSIYDDSQNLLPHELQSPLGQYSPPDFRNDQHENSTLHSSMHKAHETYQSSLEGGNRLICLRENLVSQGFDPRVAGQDECESPPKRRRIEVDPVLLLDQEQRQQCLSSETPLATSFETLPALSSFQPNYNSLAIDFPLLSGDITPSRRVVIPSGDGISQLTYDDSFPNSFPNFDLEEVWSFIQLDKCHSSVKQLPQVQKEKCTDLPEFLFDEWVHKKICEDATNRMPTGELAEALFPTVNELQRFFSGYVECFHRHFPIIHLPSLDLTETPSPLIFAICSIGAQYRLDRRRAKNLFALAGTMSSYALRAGLPITTGTPKPAPLWVMQTRVLLSLCGIFSEKTNVVMRTVENLGLFAIDYRLRRSLLDYNTDFTANLDWEEWISREASKRLLCGMFIISNLISTTFGINPGFSHTQDLEFEVLDEERLWNARSAKEWKEMQGPRTPRAPSTIRAVISDVVFTDRHHEDIEPYSISGFTMLIIMHAVNIHMWNLFQFTDVSCRHAFDTSRSTVQTTLLTVAFSTLARCHQVITHVRGGDDHSTTWSNAEGPLMFNCQALLRIAYVRLFSNISAFNRLTLLTDNPEDISSAVKAYTDAPQERSSYLTKSAVKAYEGFLAPVRIGHLLVRKTAALSWSIEHAVAGWDAALFLTKWVHTVETQSTILPPDAEESFILEQLKELLTEVESDYDGTGSLAAAIAQVWSTFLNDVWVWGVTPRMGNILHQLAIAYESNYRHRVQGV